jgi:C4-dicarboxylate transporter DctM subunit
VGLLSLGAMLFLIFAGMQIAVALMLLSFLGIWMLKASPVLAIKMLALAASGTISDYVFGVVPLFVLMGLLVSVADVGRETFEVAQWLVGRIRGGLGIATVAANAVFASITGVSIASAAVFTKVAVPPMIAHGYAPRFAVGVVAGSSVLGMLIPPSLLLIVYGVIAEVSVGQLFIAAIVPGLLLALAFCFGILAIALIRPALLGDVNGAKPPDPAETVGSAAKKLLPVVLLIGLVLGGIYGGVFTPTEAGAAGAFGALLIALARRRLNWRNLWDVLVETGHVSVSILFLIIAASMYSRMLALTGIPMTVADAIAGAELGFYGFITIYVLIVVAMGMVLDSTSIMLIVLPLTLPAMATFGADLLWFGIVTVIAVEIGLLTPPLGLTVYVVKATLNDSSISLAHIFAGAMPFTIMMLAVIVLLVAFPELGRVFVS